MIASKTGKFAEAKDWDAKRVEADPQNPDAKVSLRPHLGLPAQSRRGHGRSAQAARRRGIGYCKQAIEQAPKTTNAYTYTNLLYRERAAADLTDDEKRPDTRAGERVLQESDAASQGSRSSGI